MRAGLRRSMQIIAINMRKYFIIFAVSIIILSGLIFASFHIKTQQISNQRNSRGEIQSEVGVPKIALSEKSSQTVSNNSVSTSCETKEIICKDCNVILLSVDSLRADHMSAYGYERQTTPNFDKLAEKGAIFTNYYSTSFLTPVSEMSVHTGMYPSAHGVTNFDTILPDNIGTLAQFAKNKGYYTTAFFSSPEFEANPAIKQSFSRGFIEYNRMETDLEQNIVSIREFPNSNMLEENIKKLSTKNKFFWWVAVGGVHWPYGPSWINDVYSSQDYYGFLKDLKEKNMGLSWPDFQNIYKGTLYPDKTKLTNQDIQYVRDLYDNGVRAFDDFLGILINELKDRKLLENTIIVIQSEHGEDLGEHGYFAHYDVLDTQIHTPLLILSPQIEQGCRISSLASSVDILPTILELVGGKSLDQIQGNSLLPVIKGTDKNDKYLEVFIERNPLWEETTEIAPLLIEYKIDSGNERHKDIAIRTPKWKYIWRISKEQMEKISWWQLVSGKKIDFSEAELYDIENDSLETINVIDKYPNEAAELRKKLEDWWSEISKKSPERVEIKPTIQPYF